MTIVQCLAKNVYGVTGLYHPAGSVNAGFLLTQKFVVHVDAGMTIRDGEFLLKSSIEKLGKKPEKMWLILTHNHSDHIFGMDVFKKNNAQVVAHKWVSHFLNHRTLPSFKRVKDAYKAFIVKMITKKLSYSRERIEEILGDVKLSLPDKVFDENFSLKIDEEDLLELIYTPGHVPGEISVYHPKSQVLFAGDTIYEGMPLTTRFGGPKEWRQWIKSLENLQTLDIKKIVPGHGNICGKEEIQRNIEYLEEVIARH
jgi:glyoxylase-like metal-dependent hydrolase (beta-lactamase superfamily II)